MNDDEEKEKRYEMRVHADDGGGDGRFGWISESGVEDNAFRVDVVL